jgi:hypothetical protein
MLRGRPSKSSYSLCRFRKFVRVRNTSVRMKAFTTIYRDTETGDCLVQPSVMGPVSWTQFGEPSTVRREEFEAKIGNAVLEALDRFDKEKFDPALAKQRTPEDHRHFVNRYRSVSVTLQENGDIRIRPLHKQRGGYVGHDNESIIVNADQVGSNLPQAIRKAFELAT